MKDHFVHGPFDDYTIGQIMFDRCTVCGYLIYRGPVTIMPEKGQDDGQIPERN